MSVRSGLARLVAVALLACPLAASASERVSHGRFENVTLYRPTGDVRQVVLFLSGDHGWNADAERLAQALVAEGALVVGIDTPPLLRSFSSEAGTCVYPDGDLENLSHWVQGYARLPTYFRPLLVGHAAGAGLGYAALAQAPAGTFAGALALAFCPHLAMDHPPCDASGATPPRRPGSAHGVDLVPAAKLAERWIVLQGADDRTCPAAKTAPFVAATRGAELVRVAHAGHELTPSERWLPSVLAAYRKLAVTTSATVPPPPSALTDLPLVEVAATGADPRFAVLISGDGGWAGLDKDVAAALAARGIPVAGWDSLRYFWTARTPDGLAADLDRVLRYYAAQWQRSRALVIGYSQGADVLPFALNRLPAASRALVAETALIALGEKASFEFHVANWIGGEDADALPIRPEAEKLPPATTRCLYGEEETDSLCPTLVGLHAIKLRGGHHFDGDYAGLVDAILGAQH